MNLVRGLFPFSNIRYKTMLQISLCNGTPIGHTGLLPKIKVRKEKILGGLLCDKERKGLDSSSGWNGQMQTKCIHAN